MLTLVMGWLWGLAQGLRHALEPDHVAALSTIVVEQKSTRGTILFATAWGAGHAIVLLLFGGALLLFRAELSPPVEDVFELVVSFMLVLLGLRAIYGGFKPRAAAPHDHHGALGGRWKKVRRPFAVGIVHGLAGTGALTAVVLSQTPSAVSGLVFIAIYGTGAMLGMAVLAGVAGVPIARIAKSPRGARALLFATGAFSLVLGVSFAVPIVERLWAVG